jgi:hypothetical protein
MFPVLRKHFWSYSYIINEQSFMKDDIEFEDKCLFNSITKALDCAIEGAMKRTGTIISFHIYSN